MKKFKQVSSGDRFLVIAEGDISAWTSKQPDPNPADVRLIEVDGCPSGARKACIYIDNRNVTSICGHLAAYPHKTNNQPHLETVECKHKKADGPLPVRLLVTFVECPIRQGLCVGPVGKCEALTDILPAPGDDESSPHYRIVCDKHKEEG